MAIDWLTYASFFMSTLFLALMPGQDNIYVILQTIQHGVKVGMMIILGLSTGLVGHLLLALLGIHVLIRSNPQAFNLLKISGALYLCYLAWLSIRQVIQKKTLNLSNNPPTTLSDNKKQNHQFYLKGILLNLSNPKVLLFFIALVPQFINPEQSVNLQIIIFGVLVIASTLIVFSCLSLLAGSIKQKVQQTPNISHAINLLGAFIFITIATNLLIIEF